MSVIQKQAGQPKRQRVVLAIAAVIAIGLLLVCVGYVRPMLNKTTVGDLDLAPMPGAEVHFYLGGGLGAGNSKDYVIRLKTTDVRISFIQTHAEKLYASLNDVKADLEGSQKIEASMPFQADIKRSRIFPINSSGVQGFYQQSEVVLRTGRVKESRDLFVLKTGKVYQINFQFTRTVVPEEKQKVDAAWQQTLSDIGLPASALPVAAT